MKINAVNNIALQSVIDSIYRVSDYVRENKVNLKESSKEAVIESLEPKDGYSRDIRQLDLEERLYRGTKPFRSILESSLDESLEISDELFSSIKTPDSTSSENNSAGSGYFISFSDNASEETIQNMYNEISYRYDPSLRFETGRLVNILV